MTRLLENRILGGVCSGLGRTTRINAWLWRLLFIILTPITGGAMLLLYAMLWWLLPEQSFGDIEVGSFIRTLLAFVLIVLVVGGWFMGDQLVSDTGQDLYLPAVLVLTALVFFLQQFNRDEHARNNPLLGLVFLAISGFFLASALGAVPLGIYDSVIRSLPALLIFFGLSVFLRERFPLGGLVAVALSIGLPFIIATLAFSSRVNQVLDDNTVLVEQPIDSRTEQLTLDLSTLTSDVEIRTGASDDIVIAEFNGSTEHNLVADYAPPDANNVAILVLDETQTSSFASLNAIGRGTIDVQLPPDLSIFIKLDVQDGDVTLNLRDLDLESIETLTINRGDALITLPAFAALSPTAQDSGMISVLGGNLTIRVPDNLGLELFLNQGQNSRPQFDDLTYLLEDRDGVTWRLTPRTFDSMSITTSYIISAPNGTVNVQVIE